jgi:hypothetical protein
VDPTLKHARRGASDLPATPIQTTGVIPNPMSHPWRAGGR